MAMKLDGEFKALAIADLREAPYNPRTSYDDEQLKDLVESVKTKGVLTPLLVRPVNGHFEIVGGSRRFRAAKKAGLAAVPCQVRELSDDEALEVAILDNLQRHDISPLEEAHGFQAWLDRGHKPEELAKKIGKSVRYIYGRLELRKLAPKVLEAVEKGELPASHAQIIARLSRREDQVEALRISQLEETDYRGDDESAGTLQLFDREQPAGERTKRGLISARDLEKRVAALKIGADLIEQRDKVRHDIKESGAKLTAHLVTSGFARNDEVLSRDDWKALKKGDMCTVAGAIGISIDGKDRGKEFPICAGSDNHGDAKRCPKHFKAYDTGGGPTSQPKRTAAEETKRQAELLKERIVTRQRQFVHAAVVEAVLRGKGRATRADLLLLVEAFGDMPYHAAERLNGLFPQKRAPWGGHEEDLEACSEAQLLALLTAAALHDELESHERTKGARLYAAAKRLTIDSKKIDEHAKELVTAEAGHKERVRKWKNRTASSAASYEEPTCTRCGCTDLEGCPGILSKTDLGLMPIEGGCEWIELSDKTNKGVCSACVTEEEVAKLVAKSAASKGKIRKAAPRRR